MRKYTIYVCGTCGRESRDYDVVYQCEASHLGLTSEEYSELHRLRKKVRSACASMCNTKNAKTEADSDEAIEELIEFERKHNIKSQGGGE